MTSNNGLRIEDNSAERFVAILFLFLIFGIVVFIKNQSLRDITIFVVVISSLLLGVGYLITHSEESKKEIKKG